MYVYAFAAAKIVNFMQTGKPFCIFLRFPVHIMHKNAVPDATERTMRGATVALCGKNDGL